MSDITDRLIHNYKRYNWKEGDHSPSLGYYDSICARDDLEAVSEIHSLREDVDNYQKIANEQADEIRVHLSTNYMLTEWNKELRKVLNRIAVIGDTLEAAIAEEGLKRGGDE